MTSVVLSPAAEPLRRRLGATAWLVLEQVLLDAEPDGPPWRAGTSARRIAGTLGLDPGSVAAALRRLRAAGVVEVDQDRYGSGRFGLAGYVVGTIVGVCPAPVLPVTVEPSTVEPCAVAPCAVQPHTAGVGGSKASARARAAGSELPFGEPDRDAR